MDIYERKSEFVGRELDALLSAMDDDIEGCFYEYKTTHDGHVCCEKVIVCMLDGSEIEVNVTMDSLSAIVDDVLQKLCE